MTDEQRAAVASYFAVYQGQEKGLAKMFLRDVNHPFVSQAYKTLSAVWLQVRRLHWSTGSPASRTSVMQLLLCVVALRSPVSAPHGEV